MAVEKFTKNSVIVDYSHSLAMQLHKGVVRQNGAPYTDHLDEVAGYTESALKDSESKPAAISAAWLHDSAEDTEIDVFNPFDPPVRTADDIVYLNGLFEEAGEQGRWLCYMVDRVTNRGGNYFDYMMRNFSISETGDKRPLDLLTIVLKICDRTSNSKPDEEAFLDGVVREYQNLEGRPEEEIIRFLKRHEAIDAFSNIGNYKIDVGLLAETMRKVFREKKISNANDNLYLYLPMAERFVLVNMGQDNGNFSETKALQDPVFDYEGTRRLFKQCYEQSLQIVDNLLPSPQGTHLYLVRRSGYNRGNHILGYTPILSEIRRDKILVPRL